MIIAELWSSIVISNVQPHESFSMMAESEGINRTKVLKSMRQPPQNTVRLPKAEQWHQAEHSTELSVNSYLQTALIKHAGQASQYRIQISNMFAESFIFCPAKANTNLET